MLGRAGSRAALGLYGFSLAGTGLLCSSASEVAGGTPRQRATIDSMKSCVGEADAGLVRLFGTASLLGTRPEGSCRNIILAGKATPSPNASTSRVPRDGTKRRRLPAESDTAERMIAWSRSLAIRMT